MIKKLKIRFIALAMSALLCLLAVIVAGMNIINYNAVVRNADQILTILSENKGMFPDSRRGDGEINESEGRGEAELKPDLGFPKGMSPEIQFESRYFSVLLDDSDNAVNIDTRQIASIDRVTALEYANQIKQSGKTSGFIGDYRYLMYSEAGNTRVLFLDCGRKLNDFNTFLLTSILMSAGGYIVVFIIIFILSGKILKPIIESYEKQKQFITDAGHEIKTPLTIINANLDILEMDYGEGNESIEDIKQQTNRLRSLTDDLVMLSRMEETSTEIQKIDFPISDIVSDAAQSFTGPAKSQQKQLMLDIQPMLTLCGNEKSITQLVNILLDNALKYSPSDSEIKLKLFKKGKSICLSVLNTTESNVNPEQLKHVFDRFYRTDGSRNSETGGHGIGLSVAKAIVDAHKGSITASAPEKNLFMIYAELN